MKKLVSLIAAAALSVLAGQAGAASPQKVKIGILLPLTGTFAAVAETQKEGALLAVDVINKRGGLNMPGGKVMLEGVVQDVGDRRHAGDKACLARDGRGDLLLRLGVARPLCGFEHFRPSEGT